MLSEVRKKTELPLLCKDFIIHPYQIYQARVAGSDAILLIAAILSDQDLIYLKKIATSEKGKISDEAIKVISQVSEGSVRDAISLLDRSLIFQGINQKDQIEDSDVREMLGLADRSKTIELFKEILLGDQKSALLHLKELIENGLDAKNFLNDILEILYLGFFCKDQLIMMQSLIALKYLNYQIY